MNTLDVALSWHRKGIATIPIKQRDKRPAVLWGSYHRRLPTIDELRFWFAPEYNGDKQNIAVITGWKNLVVLDFDELNLYLLWRSWCESTPSLWHIPGSYSVLTSRGIHLYFYTDEPATNRKLPGLDIQAQAKYVIAPPSIHPSGHVYTPVDAAANIMKVLCIDAVLPPDLLVDEANAPLVQRIKQPTALPSSPYEAAMHPTDFAYENGPIKAIQERNDIIDLIGPLTKRGNKYYAKCPLHNDNDPSLQIDGQRVRCWAGCTGGKWYDYIDLFAALNGLSNQQAIQELAT